jgi:peptide/nickel transport system substrate-binding protein
VRPRNVTKMLGGLACAGLVLAACSSSPSATSSSGIPTGGTKVSGGTVTFAEPPAATPNYIFPFETSQYDTVNNVSQFQYLMYRPLYMFGSPESTSTTLDTSLSLASVPSYSNDDKSATITMGNYKWSNGEPVSATDVLFFMNMLHAQKANWYSYVPGLFPDNITGVTVSGNTLTFTFDKAYNPNWMTYNQFSQITPFPVAWDITSLGAAPGSGHCSSGAYGAASTDSACTAVYNFLTAQAQANPSSIPSSPIWSIVDGPWKLSAFDGSGDVTMVPNPSYSGPVKPSISEFKEVPFTTDTAEFNTLVGGNTIDVGYVPQQDITQPTTNALVPGPNNSRLAASYYLDPWVLFGYNYMVLKMTSVQDNGAAGAIFKQQYFRQAMQHLVDQPTYISRILKGYAVPTYGPVPVLPANPYVDAFEKSNPYPYDPAAAKQLLSSHGWKVVPGGTDTCVKPGSGPDECGAGIPAGTPLSFTWSVASGTAWITEVADAESSSWRSAGIDVTPQFQAFNTVVSSYAPPCSSPCNLEMGWWGGGWVYAPDFLPTGEVLFSTGAANNSANWSDPKTDSLILQTDTTNVSLNTYENYIATVLPGVLWEPNADYQLTEIKKDLRGVAPQNPFSTIFPENYYYVH